LRKVLWILFDPAGVGSESATYLNAIPFQSLSGYLQKSEFMSGSQSGNLDDFPVDKDEVIRINDVWKQYRLGTINHGTLARDLQSLLAKLRGREDPNQIIQKPLDQLKHFSNVADSDSDRFWALQGISFRVFRGEVCGIIGKNGAGKSTLLKILSRVTTPTRGQIDIEGRVTSLLEVGTGFHPDLTGRENIFLNGAILGMSKREIASKFDEIVAFSGVEAFIDTPVKRYSSGMYVRLAFAVSAHLESEILIVDEVLAVGDMDFQKKCLGKMGDVARSGRTVLFVSHNLAAVKKLCSRAVLLDAGAIAAQGPTDEILDAYLSLNKQPDRQSVLTSTCGRVEMKSPYWVDEYDREVEFYSYGDDYRLRFELYFKESVPEVNVGTAILNLFGERVFTSHLVDDKDFTFKTKLEGRVVIETRLNLPTLAPGNYQVVVGLRDEHKNTVLYAEDLPHLVIVSSGKEKDGAGGVLWHTGLWRQVID
jgi:lipopolysaccharide transport system ATP-binding protein